MQQSYTLVRLSPLPCVPILYVASQASLSMLMGRGLEGSQDLALVICTTLAWLGCIGLFVGGFKSAYETDARRLFTFVLIVSGFLSVLVFVGVVSYVFLATRSEPNSGEGTLRGLGAITVIFALLAWPIVSGIQALFWLTRAHRRLPSTRVG
jgi:hypothetical protein